MEKRVTSIGGVELDSKLHVREFFSPTDMVSEVKTLSDGSSVVWSMIKRNPDRTIVSMESGWLGYQNKQDLLSQYSQIGVEFEIAYSDGSIEYAIYNHAKGIAFTPLWEGSDLYTVEINMIRSS